jgi:hypothetical protein
VTRLYPRPDLSFFDQYLLYIAGFTQYLYIALIYRRLYSGPSYILDRYLLYIAGFIRACRQAAGRPGRLHALAHPRLTSGPRATLRTEPAAGRLAQAADGLGWLFRPTVGWHRRLTG